MQYVRYEEDIVQKYHVHLDGWPLEKFANPSELGNSLPLLQQLSSAIDNGTCKWVRLDVRELEERQKRIAELRAKGKMSAPKPRKPRKKGTSRKTGGPSRNTDTEGEEGGSDSEREGGGPAPSHKRRRVEAS